jgi:hypothetical protein
MLCTALFAQNYRCDWNVVDQGGGLMTSTNFRATPSVGQTAIGLISSSNYQAFIGFWQIDTAGTGIQEEKPWRQDAPLATVLYAPAPNPSAGSAQIRYSLATESQVTLRLFDLTGRSRLTLVSSRQEPGKYSVALAPHSSSGTTRLSSGIYFLKMRAGDYQRTEKVIIE